jgi:biopolymer transport protein ExbD
MKNIIIIVLIAIVLVGGYLYFNNSSLNIPNNTNQENNLTTEEIIKNKSEEVLVSINESNIEKFKTLIHPTKGVRFSKDGVVSLDADKKYTASEIDNLMP